MTASLDRPALVLAVFAIGDAPRYPGLRAFVDAIERAEVPSTTVVYAGTYGPNRPTADAIEALPPGVYAPMFGLRQTGSGGPYADRHLPLGDLAELDQRYAGPPSRAGRRDAGRDRGGRGALRDLTRRAAQPFAAERTRTEDAHFHEELIRPRVPRGPRPRRDGRATPTRAAGLSPR